MKKAKPWVFLEGDTFDARNDGIGIVYEEVPDKVVVVKIKPDEGVALSPDERKVRDIRYASFDAGMV